MYFDYLNVLVFASVGILFVFVNMIVGSVIRPKRGGEEGLEVYECGEETIGEAWVQFDIRYYTVALVYVIFAVEIAFLFPWSIVLREAMNGTGVAEGAGVGMFALVEGVAFITILFLGLAYVWAKGDLDWVLSYDGEAYRPTAERESYNIPTLEEIQATQSGDEGEEPAEETEEPVPAA